jgi:SAM-dependent methyltransferase
VRKTPEPVERAERPLDLERGRTKRFFDAIARKYDRVYALSGRTSRERLARVVHELAGRPRVLVLGLGTGRELPALLDAGHEVTGLDVSEEMTAICNRRARTVPTVVADFWASPLPFGDASFDAVIALHGTIAHPPTTRAYAELAGELARVLAAGGVFVAEVPAAEAMAHIAAAREDEDLRAHDLGGARFLHEDDAAGVSIEGVALTAQAWRSALAPLVARVEPLGEAEHLVLARMADAG